MNKPIGVVVLTPKEAHQKMTNNKSILFFDVRCEAENKFVGRPLNSILSPWLDEPDWEPHPQDFIAAIKCFVGEREQLLDTQIILICRSGYRSSDAGKCLLEYGFTHVAHVSGGFEGDIDENNQRGNLNGWRHDNLPWEQC